MPLCNTSGATEAAASVIARLADAVLTAEGKARLAARSIAQQRRSFNVHCIIPCHRLALVIQHVFVAFRMHRYATSTLLYVSIAILPKSVSARAQCFATCAHSRISQTWRGDHKCNACLRRTHMSHSLIPTPFLAHACISGPALRRGVFFQVPVAVQSLLSERGARCWQN